MNFVLEDVCVEQIFNPVDYPVIRETFELLVNRTLRCVGIDEKKQTNESSVPLDHSSSQIRRSDCAVMGDPLKERGRRPDSLFPRKSRLFSNGYKCSY